LISRKNVHVPRRHSRETAERAEKEQRSSREGAEKSREEQRSEKQAVLLTFY